MNQAVFLDRDGVVIEERDYLRKPEEVRLFPDAGRAMQRLKRAGLSLFLITNQSGVGRGYFTLADVEQVHARLNRLLAKDGVDFTKIYVAPEAPDQPSRGRKPSPQFLYDARDEFNLDLPNSFIVGDKISDLQAGWNAGVKHSILVRTGYGAQLEREGHELLHRAIIVDDLSAAADWIMQQVGL